MSEPTTPKLDPKLQEWLADARSVESAATVAPEGLDELLASVEKRMQDADSSRLFSLRSRPTWIRRAAGLLAAFLVVAVGGVLLLRGDFGHYPPVQMGIVVAALAVLLVLSTQQALRPLHRPPMSKWAQGAIVLVTLGATFVTALVSPMDATDEALPSLIKHVSPCLFYGLFFGLPVYVALRLLHRRGLKGASVAPLLAGCAAGLAGNLVLQLHCPRNDVEHLMLGHFTVAVLFVAGLAISRLVLRDRQ